MIHPTSIPPTVENAVALAFILGMGSIVASRLPTLFGDDRKIFARTFWRYGAVFGERLGAAIDRRAAYEIVDRRVVWVTTAVVAIVYWMLMVDRLSKPNALALMFAAFVTGMALQALTTKRKGRLHVAVLQPRDPHRIVPPWLFLLPAVVWCAGAIVAVMHHAVLTTGIVLVASLGAFYASYIIAAAPPIIASDDPQMDAIVDMKVRGYRMRFVLLIGALAPIALVTALEPSNHSVTMAFVIALAAIAWWSKRQGNFTASEIAAIVSSTEGA